MTPQAVLDKLLDALRDTAYHRACAFGPNDSRVVTALEMRKTVLVLIQSNAELSRALGDAISTYRHDDKETLVTAERQEAWIAALKANSLPPETA